MKAQDLFSQLPSDFNKKVHKLADNMSFDGAFYMLLGKYTEIDPDEDEEIFDELCELIVEQWPDLEF